MAHQEWCLLVSSLFSLEGRVLIGSEMTSKPGMSTVDSVLSPLGDSGKPPDLSRPGCLIHNVGHWLVLLPVWSRRQNSIMCAEVIHKKVRCFSSPSSTRCHGYRVLGADYAANTVWKTSLHPHSVLKSKNLSPFYRCRNRGAEKRSRLSQVT